MLCLLPWLFGASCPTLTLVRIVVVFVDRKTKRLKTLCNDLSEMSDYPETRHLYLSLDCSPSQYKCETKVQTTGPLHVEASHPQSQQTCLEIFRG